MLIHKLTINDELDDQLVQTESYLINTCKEYNIEYSTCECKMIPVTEGIVSGFINLVKTIFQKVIAFLVKIWKTIVEFVKSVIKKIVEVFKRLLGIKKKHDVPVYSAIITNPSKKTEKIAFKSVQDMVTSFKKSISEFNKQIDFHSRQNIDATKKMESMTVRSVHESYDVLKETQVVNKTKLIQDDINLGNVFTGADRDEYFKGLSQTIINAEKSGQLTADKINLQANDHISHAAINNIGLLDTKMMKSVLESDNIIEAYSVFLSGSIQKLRQLATKKDDVPGVSLYKAQLDGIIQICDAYKNFGIDDNTITAYLTCKYAPTIENAESKEDQEAFIRKWLRLRINWNNGIVNMLRRMVQKNTEFLNISTEKADILCKELENGETQGVRNLLDKNRDKIITKWGVDARPLGLGCICVGDDIKFLAKYQPGSSVYDGWWNYLTDFKYCDAAITYLTKYDVTVCAHGADAGDCWVMEVTPWPNGSYPKPYETDKDFQRVDDYVIGLIKQGFKRINIVSCNPGGYSLAEEIRDNKKVLVRINSSNALIA